MSVVEGRLLRSIGMLKEAMRQSNRGNLHMEVALLYLSIDEWGLALQELNEAQQKGGIESQSELLSIKDDIHQKLGYAPNSRAREAGYM